MGLGAEHGPEDLFRSSTNPAIAAAGTNTKATRPTMKAV
jgi:hypothetical protein